jgi:sulfotransferase
MNKKYHFITGLPRSGSTLLTSLLLQNPRFHSSITDPVCTYTKGILDTLKNEPGMKFEVPSKRRADTIRGMIDGYYSSVDKEVIFNTNRGWSHISHVVKEVYPNSKFLVCVRDVNWVLDSLECLQRKNPLMPNTTTSGSMSDSIYERVANWMSPTGIVGYPFSGVKQIITGEHKDSLIIIEYENLCRNPEKVLRAIYSFIEEPYFEHDFENAERSWDEYDSVIGIPVHRVRGMVQVNNRKTILPPDILNMYKDFEVWRY